MSATETTPRVRVVNVRGLKTPAQRAGIVYVGRKCYGWADHPLRNPFVLPPTATLADRGRCLRRYVEHLASMRTADLNGMLDELWAATGAGQLPLGCWCHPLPCHADILAALLTERFLLGGQGS